jgi:hypothetical protein
MYFFHQFQFFFPKFQGGGRCRGCPPLTGRPCFLHLQLNFTPSLGRPAFFYRLVYKYIFRCSRSVYSLHGIWPLISVVQLGPLVSKAQRTFRKRIRWPPDMEGSYEHTAFKLPAGDAAIVSPRSVKKLACDELCH